MQSTMGLSGKLTMKVLKRNPVKVTQDRKWKFKNFIRMALSGELFVPLVAKAASLIPGVTVMYGKLSGKVIKNDGTVVDLGVMGYHLITTAGKNYVASTFNSVAEPENLRYHGYGTGTTAAAVGDTALQTELTTQYASDSTRPTGSQANSTNTYTTVGTLSPDSGGTIAVTEWGLLSQAATGGGTLFDRQVFSAVNIVASADSLQTTYVLTVS
jgi:hypothetical protein